MGKQMAFDLSDDKQGERLYGALPAILDNLIGAIKKDRLSAVLSGEMLTGNDTVFNSKPETVTKESIVEPILSLLGYAKLYSESGSGFNGPRDTADYTAIAIGEEKVLIEVEPINKKLSASGSGVWQVGAYLNQISFNSRIGIATDGLKWILVRYDIETRKAESVDEVDIGPIMQSLYSEKNGQKHIDSAISDYVCTLGRLWSVFSAETIVDGSVVRLKAVKEKKREITSRFYKEYIKLVFGVEEGKRERTQCLLDGIRDDPGRPISDENRRLFAVTLMNRFLFIRFLEDKGLVSNGLLNELWSAYRKSELGTSFYSTYLKTMFYEVLNKSRRQRSKKVSESKFFADIPYLNGGLFRHTFNEEELLDVDDNEIERIYKFLEGYRLRLSSDKESLDPDILGNVFEQTINFLTADGTNDGTNARKKSGAYYTGEDITSHIVSNTLGRYIYRKWMEIFASEGASEWELKKYPNLESVLGQLPYHPDTKKKMLEIVDSVRIVDPACGSGHFLTTATKELCRIKRCIYNRMESQPTTFQIKKDIISNSIYGVDIQKPAVEIAKLRLWLSLIEDIDVTDHTQVDTLPNIEYNIINGNSLFGWMGESSQIGFINPDQNISPFLSGLRVAYAGDDINSKAIDEIAELMADADSGFNYKSIKEAYAILRRIYARESDAARASKLRNLIEEVREIFYKDLRHPVIKKLSKDPYKTIRNDIRRITNDKERTEEKLRLEKEWESVSKDMFHWGMDFGTIIDNGGFDIVIGNPPYGAMLSGWERDYVRRTLLPSIPPKVKLTSELSFIAKADSLVKDGGYIGLIVPLSIAFVDLWTFGRNIIKRDLETISDVSKAFKDAKYEMMIYTLAKGCAPQFYEVISITSGNRCLINKQWIDCTNVLMFEINNKSVEIYQKLQQSPHTMGNISKTFRGVSLNGKTKRGGGNYKVYRGEDISQFFIRNSEEYLDEMPETQASRMSEYPKIMSQCIVSHVTNPKPHLKVMSYLDTEGLLSIDTIENTVFTSKEWSPEFIVCMMNSHLTAWYLHDYVYNRAIRTMHFDDVYIKKIPLPSQPINDCMADKYREIYARILDSKRPLFKKGKESGQEAQQCLLDEMNMMIYQEYGLTDEDISYIESFFRG